MRTTIDSILIKIRTLRKEKGLSLENMADELGISLSAYRKIENHQCKLTVERLVLISIILEIPVIELLNDLQYSIYNQKDRGNGTLADYQRFNNHYHQNNKEITHLKSEIIFLRDLVK